MWPTLTKVKHAKPLVGFLSSRSPGRFVRILTAFRNGLAEAGNVDGHDIDIEYRWADGDYEKLPALATDIVRRDLSVLIAAGGEPSALAAKVASDNIPIVFSVGGDPVKIGLVEEPEPARQQHDRHQPSLPLNWSPSASGSAARDGTRHEGYSAFSSIMTSRPRRKRIEVMQAAHELRQADRDRPAQASDNELASAFGAWSDRCGRPAVCGSPFFDTPTAHASWLYEAQRGIPGNPSIPELCDPGRFDELRDAHLPTRTGNSDLRTGADPHEGHPRPNSQSFNPQFSNLSSTLRLAGNDRNSTVPREPARARTDEVIQ